MQFSLKPIIALFLTCGAVSAHAELAAQQQEAQATEEKSLVSRVLSQDSPNFNNHFNHLNSLTITKRTGDKVYQETVSTKIEVPQEAPSVVDKLNTVASNTVRKFSQTGMASWYGRQFHGKKTANGETFDMNALTAAHRSLPLNCYIRVTNKDNGKSVVVRVNDRGPFQGDRVLDLSYGAAKAIGLTQRGTGNVIIERVDGP